MIQVFAFYLFAALMLMAAALTIFARNPGALGAVADRRLLQRGGADGAASARSSSPCCS
jgi:hypothetical protein